MLLHPLTGYFTVSNSQHGFVPHRGTLTAWRILLDKILDSRNILELDFEGFYPSITSDMVLEGCLQLKRRCPSEVLHFYKEMSDSKPRLTFDADQDHGVARLKMVDPLVNTRWLDSYRSNFYKEQQNASGSTVETMKARWSKLNKKLVESRRLRELAIRKYHYYGDIYYKSEYETLRGERLHTTGLPQGAGTSPYLSILYLEFVMSEITREYPSLQYLSYADDIIIYGNSDTEFDQFLKAINVKLSSRFKSIVDYSAAQLENKGAGFSGARTSNLTQDHMAAPN